MRYKKYMVLLVDRQKANMFIIVNGMVLEQAVLFDDQVPQKVKHGDDTWDAQNKIFRHIEDHLHRHLVLISQKAANFAKENSVRRILIGGHKPLLVKIQNHLTYPYADMVIGTFVTELKGPFDDVLKRITTLINRLEQEEPHEKVNV